MSFINLFSKRCVSDKSYRVQTYIKKYDCLKDVAQANNIIVEYKNGFYCNHITAFADANTAENIKINLPSGIILTIKISVDDLPKAFLDEIQNTNDATVLIDKYITVTPIDKKNDVIFAITTAMQCLFSVSYPIINNNGGKSFDIRITNTKNNYTYSCNIKTGADKDNKTSSGSIDDASISNSLKKLLEVNEYNTPIIFKFNIKEL